jgi:anti-anti-sigma factor
MAATISSPTPLAQLRIAASCPAPGTVRVAVAGEIDLSTAGVLHAELLNALSARLPDRIEVDLAGVTFLDCGGLTVLIVAGKAAARTGCRLRITNPQPIVRRVLDLTGLLGVLTPRFDQAPAGETRSGPASPIGPTSGNVTEPATLLVAA